MRRAPTPAAVTLCRCLTAACGAGPPSAASSMSAGPGAEAMSNPAVVTTGELTQRTALMDARGRPLYAFRRDRGGRSACYGHCAAAWPPLLTTDAPRAMGAAETGLLGTSQRSDGATQVTYGGHPLYSYGGDSRPGQALGQGREAFGGAWGLVGVGGRVLDGR